MRTRARQRTTASDDLEPELQRPVVPVLLPRPLVVAVVQYPPLGHAPQRVVHRQRARLDEPPRCALDRVVMSVAILPMTEQYGYSDSTKGAIAAGFSVGYCLGLLPTGLADSLIARHERKLLDGVLEESRV